MRLVQHKKEAYWFYRFLSIFYDDYVNPFFWTPRMRAEALELAGLDRRDLTVVDVGSGTGFTTEGIVQHVDPEGVTCLDQSPHQMAHARRKPALQGSVFLQGDAENLPFPDDRFDRYVSAGSIEYWPDPQRGIAEAYRVIKPGGVALMIGPLRPEGPLARWAADTWMLFPEEADYVRWFTDAGFTAITHRYVAPGWVRRERYGIAIAGVKPAAGPSHLAFEPPAAEAEASPAPHPLVVAGRVVAGSLAGGLFIPAAIFGVVRQGVERALGRTSRPADPVTPQQVAAIGVLTALVAWLVGSWLRRR